MTDEKELYASGESDLSYDPFNRNATITIETGSQMTFEIFYVLKDVKSLWFVRDCEGSYTHEPSKSVRFSCPEHAQRYADLLYRGKKLEIIKVSVSGQAISES